MTVTILNPNGIFLRADGRITDLVTNQKFKISIQFLPGANKDVVQRMGRTSQIFNLKGFVTTLTGSTYINDLVNYTGSIAFSSNLGNLLTATTVAFYDLQWIDAGSRPLERTFTINAVELI